MKIKNLIITIFVSVIAIVTTSCAGNSQTLISKKGGEIKIRDHKAIVAGTIRKDKDIFTINLDDITKLDGHICGCNTAGFIITKNVLKMLFPNQIPNRNSVKVSISEYNRDMLDAITFITGIRLNTGQYTNTGNELVVDTSLAGKKGATILIFERKDTGKKVKVVLDKNFLLTKDEMMTIMTIKPKMMKKQATKEEIKKYADVTRAIVNRELTNLPENAITYTILK